MKEEILIKVLELMDRGKTPEEIHAAFPEEVELKEYISLMENLRAAGRGIVPSKELLKGALRRARAAEEAAPRVRVASAGFFGRIPFGLRVLAPALVVILVFVALDRPPESAVITEITYNSDASGDAGVSDSAARSAPETFMAKSGGAGDASTESSAAGAALSAPAPTAAGTAGSSGASASEVADKVAAAYLASAAEEESSYSGTSAAEEAASANDSQSIGQI